MAIENNSRKINIVDIEIKIFTSIWQKSPRYHLKTIWGWPMGYSLSKKSNPLVSCLVTPSGFKC